MKFNRRSYVNKEKRVVPNLNNIFPTHMNIQKGIVKINAEGRSYRDLNAFLRTLKKDGVDKIELRNVYGQRYIGTGVHGDFEIEIHGTPGNNLGAFMNGKRIIVYGNAQDGCGNTMDEGEIIIHGHVGDIVGYSMRGGKIFIRDNAGYRAGIHMKGHPDKRPFLVIGGTAQDFLGEYMAGGVLIVLGLNLKKNEPHNARFVGTGMHGGKMYIHGEVHHLGKDVEGSNLEEEDWRLLRSIVNEFSSYFKLNADEILEHEFNKIVPLSHRPYGQLYAQ